MKVTIIGDMHNDGSPISPDFFQAGDIQIGDLDITGYKWANFDEPRYFIDGNHERFPDLKPYSKLPYEVHGNLWHIPRGFFWDSTLFIGGGNTIDLLTRKREIDIFHEESPPYSFFRHLLYREDIKNKVRTIISHECPETTMVKYLKKKPLPKTLANMALILNEILNHFKPKLWIFGHHHESLHCFHEDCEFICLSPKEKITLDIPMKSLENCHG